MLKHDIIAVINAEIEDRTDTDTEGNHAEELIGLNSLKQLISSDSSLKPDDYCWLCYLVANHREAEIREELE